MTFSNEKNRNRSGFTLIELLMVIAIIGVMSSMALGLMKKAQDDAKQAATLSRIAQIEAILAVQMEAYEVRRLPVTIRNLGNSLLVSGSGKLVQVKNLRHQIIADLIDVEMPRPFYDISIGKYKDNSNGSAVDEIGDFKSLTVLEELGGWGIPKSAEMNRWTRLKRDDFNLPSEYLYEILQAIEIDGTPGIEMLGNQTIGDSDEDRILEVVDAWGGPFDFKIEQLDCTPSGSYVWVDGTNYVPLDTTKPRSVNKIRFVVTSNRIN